ncbi:hypothetical protein ID867_11100 [Streptomyces parvulus]|nr:hypothetical protein [Streptomyces parvulus]
MVADLTDLVLPAECGGCGSARSVLCPGCRTALSGAPPRRVRPAPEPPGLPPVHAAAPYADAVRAALLAHKERGVLALTAPLGAALAGAVRAGLREAGTTTAEPAARAGGREDTAEGPASRSRPRGTCGGPCCSCPCRRRAGRCGRAGTIRCGASRSPPRRS